MLEGKFNPNKTDFCWHNAAHLAWCSAFAYQQPLSGRKLAKAAGYKAVFFNVDGAQGYGLRKDDYVILAFRGTEPKEKSDIVADLKAWKSSSKYKGKVHAGFKDEAVKLMPEIEKFMQKHKDAKRVFVTGHSLGAAIATVVTTRLGHPPVATYTYGSPRVGNREFAHAFDTDYRCHRFVNNNDIVTAVPGPIMYDHVGQLHYISYTGKIHTSLNPLQRAWDKIRGLFRAWRKGEVFDHVYDHEITRYAKAIERNCT